MMTTSVHLSRKDLWARCRRLGDPWVQEPVIVLDIDQVSFFLNDEQVAQLKQILEDFK